MSELSNAIKAYRDTEKRCNTNPFLKEHLNVFDEYKIDSDLYETLYRIKLVLESRVWLTERDKNKLEIRVKECKMAIIEAVFGEFRPYFHRIKAAIYERDNMKAQALLNEMHDRMFDV